jgi:disulfide bond formation protein DsbB
MSLIYSRGNRSRQNENPRSCFHLKLRHIARRADSAPCEMTRIEMHQPLAMKRAWDHRLGGRPAVLAALALFVVSLGTLLGAWYFQYVVGLAPCPLCLDQRIPYYLTISLSLLLAIAARAGVPRRLVAAGFAVILVAVLCSAALGAYHAGVEWRFWPGPADCTGPLADLTSGGSLLDQLNGVHVVRCDEAAWRFLGISLAGYNTLISLAMATIAAFGLLALRARRARNRPA